MRTFAAAQEISRKGLSAAVRSVAAFYLHNATANIKDGPEPTLSMAFGCCSRSPHSGPWSRSQHFKRSDDRIADKTALGFFDFAYAAHSRTCGGSPAAMQRMSSKQPLKSEISCQIQTTPSLRAVPTNGLRDLDEAAAAAIGVFLLV